MLCILWAGVATLWQSLAVCWSSWVVISSVSYCLLSLWILSVKFNKFNT